MQQCRRRSRDSSQKIVTNINKETKGAVEKSFRRTAGIYDNSGHSTSRPTNPANQIQVKQDEIVKEL
jgi:hypothetical protein